MKHLKSIFELTNLVLQNNTTLDQATRLLSTDNYKSALTRSSIEELDAQANAQRIQNPQVAYVMSLLSFEAARLIAIPELIAHCGATLSSVYLGLGHYRNAIEILDAILPYFEEHDNKQALGAINCNLGIAYSSQGEYSQAITHIQKSLTISREINDKNGEGIALNHLGFVHILMANYDSGIEFLDQSLSIAQSLEDRFGENCRLNRLGIAYNFRGEYSSAIKFNERALEIAREINDRLGEETALSNLGNDHSSLGDYSRSFEYHQLAYNIALEIGDIQGKGKSCGNLGNAYFSLGDYKRAIEYYKSALVIFRQIGDQHQESDILANLGLSHYSLSDNLQAIDHLTKALLIAKEISHQRAAGSNLGHLGSAYCSMGDYKRAINYHQKALDIARKITDRRGEGVAHSNLGLGFLSLRKFRKALENYRRANAIAQEIGAIDDERLTLSNMGIVYEQGFELTEEAYRCYEKSIQVTEKIRSRIHREKQRTGFLGRSENVYDLMILLCNKMKASDPQKLIEAFEHLERSKSRTLLESLAHTSFNPSREVPRDLLDHEGALLQQTRSLYFQREKRQSVSIAEIEKLESDLDETWNEIEEVDPEYVSLRRGRPWAFDQIHSLVTAPGDSVCLVEYFFSSDKLLIFILRSDDPELQVEEVDFPADRLSYYLKHYSDEFLNPQMDQYDLGQVWQGLSKYLIDPVIKYLDGIETIYLVPFRQLHYLPLHALRHNGRYLIERYKIVYSPSASVIRYCQNKRRSVGSDVESLVVGVAKEGDSEQLRQLIEDEADRVGAVLGEGSSVYKGDQVTKELIRQESQGKDIIHFSCHGFFDAHIPMRSGLQLADGVLTVEDIYQLNLNASLVTLSACQTGLSEHKPGDDLIGLTRSLLYAGTPSVLVSLWSVPATSTRELMERFYAHLGDGKTKAESLQKAQLDIMRMPQYQHPYHWAPFTLVGDWK